MRARELAFLQTARLDREGRDMRQSQRRAKWANIRSACMLTGTILGLIIILLCFMAAMPFRAR